MATTDNKGKNGEYRLIYVEPNDIVEGRGDNARDGLIDGVPVTPEYTDLCIYVDLLVETFSRTEVEGYAWGSMESKIYRLSYLGRKDDGNTYLSYFQGQPQGNQNFFTTYYTDPTFQDVRESDEKGRGKILEGLGISNINITFENYFIPLVTIKFVDVRGTGFFGREEEIHDENDDLIADNIFGGFFTFPYPKFKLTVKGFFGKPVTYQLLCKSFSGTFNSQTGCFELDVTFIGYQYSLLSDIPMAYIIAAPMCEYEGKKYWNAHVKDRSWLLYDKGNPNGVKAKPLYDILQNVESAYKRIGDNNGIVLNNRDLTDDALIKQVLETEFAPYIGNVFKLVMCHLETFIHMMYHCANEIYSQIRDGKRKYSDLNVNPDKPVKVSGAYNHRKTEKRSTKDEQITPFPQIYLDADSDSKNTDSIMGYLLNSQNQVAEMSGRKSKTSEQDNINREDWYGWTGVYEDSLSGNDFRWEETKLVNALYESLIQTSPKYDVGEEEPTEVAEVEEGEEITYPEKEEDSPLSKVLLVTDLVYGKTGYSKTIVSNQYSLLTHLAIRMYIFSCLNKPTQDKYDKWKELGIQTEVENIKAALDKYIISEDEILSFLKRIEKIISDPQKYSQILDGTYYKGIKNNKDKREIETSAYNLKQKDNLISYFTSNEQKNKVSLRKIVGGDDDLILLLYGGNNSGVDGILDICDSSEVCTLKAQKDSYYDENKNFLKSKFFYLKDELPMKDSDFVIQDESPIIINDRRKWTIAEQIFGWTFDGVKESFDTEWVNTPHPCIVKRTLNVESMSTAYLRNIKASCYEDIPQDSIETYVSYTRHFIRENEFSCTKGTVLTFGEGLKTLLSDSNKKNKENTCYKYYYRDGFYYDKIIMDDSEEIDKYFYCYLNKESKDGENLPIIDYKYNGNLTVPSCMYKQTEITSNMPFMDISLCIKVFERLVKFYKEKKEVENEGTVDDTPKEEEPTAPPSKDIKAGIYRYLSSLWNKWLLVRHEKDFTVEKFFPNFSFIDSYYLNIANILHISADTLRTMYSGLSEEHSLLFFLSDLANSHGCMMFALPDVVDLNGYDKGWDNLKDVFKPYSYNDIIDTPLKEENNFVVMYSHSPASSTKTDDDNENNVLGGINDTVDSFNLYKGDGKMLSVFRKGEEKKLSYIGEKGKDVLLDSLYGYYVPSFAVSYSRQNNHLFKGINVSMKNPIVTEYSIKAVNNILESATGNNHKVLFHGQDLYPVFSNYSYTCDVEMMGNAQITPLMYFQLMNVPLFRGAYMIYKVSHSITPGNFTTNFSGMKMSKRFTRWAKEWFSEAWIKGATPEDEFGYDAVIPEELNDYYLYRILECIRDNDVRITKDMVGIWIEQSNQICANPSYENRDEQNTPFTIVYRNGDREVLCNFKAVKGEKLYYYTYDYNTERYTKTGNVSIDKNIEMFQDAKNIGIRYKIDYNENDKKTTSFYIFNGDDKKEVSFAVNTITKDEINVIGDNYNSLDFILKYSLATLYKVVKDCGNAYMGFIPTFNSNLRQCNSVDSKSQHYRGKAIDIDLKVNDRKQYELYYMFIAILLYKFKDSLGQVIFELRDGQKNFSSDLHTDIINCLHISINEIWVRKNKFEKKYEKPSVFLSLSSKGETYQPSELNAIPNFYIHLAALFENSGVQFPSLSSIKDKDSLTKKKDELLSGSKTFDEINEKQEKQENVSIFCE